MKEALKSERAQNKYDKNLELIRRYREGDRAAGEELAILNSPLVYNVAGRFLGRGIDREELFEMGSLGLVKAINTFDFSRETAFSTYAVPLIFGEIRRFLRDDGMIKVSREAKRIAALVNAERDRRAMLGLDTGIVSIAREIGITEEDAAAALFAVSPVSSLDECVFDDEGSVTLGACVFDEDEGIRNFDKLAIRFALEGLCDTEREIILLRYYKDYSQAEVARILGLTQVKVSRVEKKILARLREELA